jgi:hypothetical protein
VPDGGITVPTMAAASPMRARWTVVVRLPVVGRVRLTGVDDGGLDGDGAAG